MKRFRLLTSLFCALTINVAHGALHIPDIPIDDPGDGGGGDLPLPVPGVPGSLGSDFNSLDGHYTLDWAAASGVVERYELRENGALVTLSTPVSRAKSFSDKAYGRYDYKVRACNDAGCSAYTPAIRVSYEPFPKPLPSAPSANVDGTTANVAWQAAEHATHYNVSRLQLNPMGSMEFLGSVSTLNMEIPDHPLGMFQFNVTPCNAKGCTSMSNASPQITVLDPELPVANAQVIELPLPESEFVGTLSGSGSVAAHKASYQVDIPIPPGRAGMQPEVSLKYTSTNGTAVAGAGWSVATGSGSINRCPTIEAIDGFNQPIQYTEHDRLCWNGQRLIAVSGTYGNTGAEYSTEINNFARVRQFGGSLFDPATYFEIELKNGRIEQYGTNDAVNRPTDVFRDENRLALSWHLDVVKDRLGNRIDYDYETMDDEFLLTSIAYTGFASSPGNREVQFTYEPRFKTGERHHLGLQERQKHRLTAITSFANTGITGFVDLNYQQSVVSSTDLLHSVQLCSSENCTGTGQYEPTYFEYNDDRIQYTDARRVRAIPESHQRDSKSLTHDYDGDGTPETIFTTWGPIESGQVPPTTPLERWLYMSSNPTNPIDITDRWLNLPEEQAPDVEAVPFYGRGVADFNMDGKADTIGFANNRLYIGSWNNETQEFDSYPTNLSASLGDTIKFTEDFNLDGRADLLIKRYNTGDYILYEFCDFSDSVVNFCRATTLDEMPSGPDRSHIPRKLGITNTLDIDGNGVKDFVIDWVWPKQPDGEFRTLVRQGFIDRDGNLGYHERSLEDLGGPAQFHSSSYRQQRYWLDANGDGLHDILSLGDVGGDKLYINTGSGFIQNLLTSDIDVLMKRAHGILIADYDNDGRDDLLVPSTGQPTHNYCISYLPPDADETGADFTYCGYSVSTSGSHQSFIKTNKFRDDRSIYPYSLVKFNLTVDNTYQPLHQPTELELPFKDTKVVDWNGDGLQDLIYHIRIDWSNGHDHDGDGYVPIGDWPPGAPASGQYIVFNNPGEARFGTDLLRRATDGLGKINEWQYDTLSGSGSSQCYYDAIRPFYRVDRTKAAPDHYHFNTNMIVVAEHRTSNGIGGLNSSCYLYEDAMFSANGRGFQGFKTITTLENFPDDKNKFSRTEYHDRFPLTGKPKRTTIGLASDGPKAPPLSRTITIWGCDDDRSVDPDTDYPGYVDQCADADNDGIYFVYKTQNYEYEYDLVTRSRINRTSSSIYVEYDDYGNALDVYSSANAFDQGVMVMKTRQRELKSFDYSAVSDWWINKLVKNTSYRYPTYYAHEPKPSAAANDIKTVFAETEYLTDGSRLPARVQSQRSFTNQEKVTVFADYDEFGNPAHVIEHAPDAAERNKITTYTAGIDAGYFPKTVTNAMGHETEFVHDRKTGTKVLETDPNGIVTNHRLDVMGRLKETVAEGRPSVHHVTQDCGSECPSFAVFKKVTVSDGSPTRTEYIDGLGRVIKTAVTGFGDNPETVTVTEFNARGYKVRESQPSFESTGAYFTTYGEFDALGRYGTKTIDRSGHTVDSQTWRYQHEGIDTHISLPDGVLTASRKYGAKKLLLSTTDANDSTTQFRHDGAGNLILIQDVAGNQVVYYYDNLNRLIRIDDVDAGTELTTYSGLGDKVRMEDANGNVVRNDYDLLGRRTHRFINDKPDATWTYDFDTLGKLSSVTSADGQFQESYEYDELARVTRTTTTIEDTAYETLQSYDRYYGREKGRRLPSGEMIGHTYDEYGYLVSEYNPGNEQAYYTVETVDARGNITQERFGNGLVGYHDFSASTGAANGVQVDSASTTLQQIDYYYDDAFGNLTRRDNVRDTGVVSETFNYDLLQRLTAATRNGEFVDYEYDAIGNLLLKSDFGASYHYGDVTRSEGKAGPHAVTRVEVDGATYIYSYDDKGNLLSGQGRTLTYNVFNKPTEILEGGVETRFGYDPNFRLYKRADHQAEVWYVTPEYEEVRNLGTGQITQKSYLTGNIVVESSGDNRRVNYLHHDRLKSVTLVTDAAGDVVHESGYDAFGQPLDGEWQSTDGLLNPQGDDVLGLATDRGFTGHKHMDHHKVIHMGGRLYDPLLGRFFSPDPFITNAKNTQSQNPYSYVMNNPLVYVDPTGYQVACNESACATDEDGEGSRLPTATANHANDNGRQNLTREVVEGTNKVVKPTSKIIQLIDSGLGGTGETGRFFGALNVVAQAAEVLVDVVAPDPTDSDVDRDVKGMSAGIALAGYVGRRIPAMAAFATGWAIGRVADNEYGITEGISDRAHDSEALNADKVAIKKSDHKTAVRNVARRQAAKRRTVGVTETASRTYSNARRQVNKVTNAVTGVASHVSGCMQVCTSSNEASIVQELNDAHPDFQQPTHSDWSPVVP